MAYGKQAAWWKLLAVFAVWVATGSGHAARAEAVGGSKWSQDVVLAEDSDVYHVSFRAGRFAQVRLHSYGETWLELRIYDAQNRLVAQARDTSSDALATWMARGGVYRIVVINPAPLDNPYFLSTN